MVVRAEIKRAHLLIEKTTVQNGWIASDEIVEVSSQIKAAGVGLPWPSNAGMITFKEQVLEVGKRISVVGFCHFEGKQLVVASGDSIKSSVVICDDEDAARVNPSNPAPGFRTQ